MNDAMWKREQWQTRWEITKSQSRYWSRWFCSLWLLSSLLIFCAFLWPAERRQEVGSWLWVNAWAILTPADLVTWHGQQYIASQIAPWLSGTKFHGTPLTWLLWCGVLGACCASGAVALLHRHIAKGESGDKHIRGTQLVEPAALNMILRKQGPGGLRFGPVQIPEAQHRQHVLICGATRSGKSNTIRHALVQIEQREETAIVVDPEGEFVQQFYQPERGDVILNPFDARCPSWSPWAECTTPADYETQAASLFPFSPRTPEAAKYYRKVSRIVYQVLLRELTDHDPHQLCAVLTSPDGLLDVVAGTEAETILGNPRQDQWRNVVSTLTEGCHPFHHLPLNRHSWSAREWAENPRGWLFLTAREQDKAAALPLLSLWLDALAGRLISRPTHPAETTWLVIDELASIGYQQHLHTLLERGAKRGLAVMLGFQNILQIQEVYGRAAAVTMLDQPATRLYFRVNNSETALWMSKEIDSHEVERMVESETAGPEDVRDGVSRSVRRNKEEVVLPAECKQLQNLTGYLNVAPFGISKITIPYLPAEQNHPAFQAPAPKKITLTRKEPVKEIRPL